MRITLNLATRPYADLGPALKRLRIGLAVLVVIGALLGVGLRAFHEKAKEARANQESVQRKIDQISRERASYQAMMRQPENAAVLAQARALNTLFEEKTFSWTLAMEDLEMVLPGGVQVVSIEPQRDVKTGIITVKLRVVGPRDKAVDLVGNLEHSRHFVHPRLNGESTESNGGAGERLEPISASNRVNFELQAEFNPAASLDQPRTHKAEAAPEVESKPTTVVLPVVRSLSVPAKNPAPPVPVPQHVRPPFNGAPPNRFNPNAGGPR